MSHRESVSNPNSPWLRWRTPLAFAAGLLLGWWLLGWWLFPVDWGDASPGHLDEASRADYVQLVADAYARNADLAEARRLLDDLPPQQLGRSLLRLTSTEGSAAQVANSRVLARNMGIDLAAVASAATAEAAEAADGDAQALPGAEDPLSADPASEAEAGPGSFAPPGVDPARDQGSSNFWPRVLTALAWLALAGGLVAIALIAASLWRWRVEQGDGLRGPTPATRPGPGSGSGEDSGAGRGPRSGRAAGGRASASPTAAAAGDDEATGALRAPSPAPRVGDGPRPSAQAARPAMATGPEKGLDATRPLPQVRPRQSPSAPAWQPSRIELDQTVDARFQEGENQAIHTWLVYDRRSALVGGAGLLAQSIGGVNTVDLWFSDRDDVDQTSKTPTVTFVTQRAIDDPVLRARLSDRRLVAAVPGQTCRLETVDLLLDVQVHAVEPPPESGVPSLKALVLSLTPSAQPGTGLQRAIAAESRFEDGSEDDEVQDEGAWDADLDEDIDAAFEPPRPLPFRKDD